MKDIPTEELASISPEIHEAAVRVGCEHVSITGNIWPGGQLSGTPETAARFVEYSWWRAVVVNGKATLEEDDAACFHQLLKEYGMEEETYVAPTPEAQQEPEAPASPAPPPRPLKVRLEAEVHPETLRELERQATAAGLSIGELLDWKLVAARQEDLLRDYLAIWRERNGN